MLSRVVKTLSSCWVAGALVAFGGCSTMQDFAGIPRTGHQADGTYVVGADEEKMACRQIKERLDILSSQIKTLPERAALEQEAGPQTVGSALGRMFGGPGDGLKSTTDFKRATAESDALNALLIKKRCV
jgi:hypothetical protein